jgi:hypothetical protein
MEKKFCLENLNNLKLSIKPEIILLDIHLKGENSLDSIENLQQKLGEDNYSKFERFMLVNLLNEQPPNHIFYDNGHIDWDLSGGRAIGTYNSVAKDLTEAKETVRMILNNIRSDKELTPISVTIQNRSINVPIEPVFRLNLINRLSSLDDNATCKVQFANNIWLDVTKNELTQIHNEVEIAVQNGYDWQYSRAVLVDQAQTVADLEQILNQE